MSLERLKEFDMDVIVSSIGSQIKTLENLRRNIEESHLVSDYTNEVIKEVEKNLYWLRKFIINN